MYDRVGLYRGKKSLCCVNNSKKHLTKRFMATADIYDLMDELSRQFPWIGICVNKIDVTNVGRQHDLTELLNPAEDIVIDTSLRTVPDCRQQETE